MVMSTPDDSVVTRIVPIHGDKDSPNGHPKQPYSSAEDQSGVKEEEIDWIVYHQIDQIGPALDERIADVTGFSLPPVAASLERLEKNFLVAAGPEGWRVLSIQESMVRCQFAYADGFPLTIENGVIRVREPSDE